MRQFGKMLTAAQAEVRLWAHRTFTVLLLCIILKVHYKSFKSQMLGFSRVWYKRFKKMAKKLKNSSYYFNLGKR